MPPAGGAGGDRHGVRSRSSHTVDALRPFIPQADQVAHALVGLAHVAVTPRASLAAMIGRTGLDLSPGANVYLWWANPNRPTRRPQAFRGDSLAPSQWGTPAWPVVRSIFGAAAFRLDPPALASEFEAESTRRRLRSVEEGAASADLDGSVLKEWESDLVRLEQTQQQVADLELETDRLQRDLNALLAAFDVTVAKATRARLGPGNEEGGTATPATLADADITAEKRSTATVYLPEAFRSAEEWRYRVPTSCSPL